MFTEDEAKTKWCPFARVVPAMIRDGKARVLEHIPAHNRIDEIDSDDKPTWNGAMRCEASLCMAWRCASKRVLRSRTNPAETRPVVPGSVYSSQDWFMDEELDTQRGYCGLAGKMED